jgi:hypothetical protein
MARPRDFRESNVTLAPPDGVPPADCALLPVLAIDGTLVSCWELSPEEIVEIVETGVVWLAVWGRSSQPPVMVSGCKAAVI